MQLYIIFLNRPTFTFQVQKPGGIWCLFQVAGIRNKGILL